MNRISTVVLTFAMALPATAALSATALAQEECAPQDEGETVTQHRLVRQLALDLLGRIPTMDEWSRLEAGASIDDELLPEFLESDEYFAVVREQHRALIWGSLGNIDDITAGGWRIGPLPAARGGMWRVGNLRRRFRGINTLDCADRLQTEFDADGRPIGTVVSGADGRYNGGLCDDPDGAGPRGRECRQEGYVMVTPWWGTEPIKVCAYDAQSLDTGSNGQTCHSYNPNVDCGCGENLNYCMSSAGRVGQREVRRAIEEEPARIFEGIIREGRSYLEAFTTRESWVNGATSHYYRYGAGAYTPRLGGQIGYDAAMGAVPAIPFPGTDEWVRVERAEGHSGILTTMGYLMRFASNRARANRFYTAFRCEPFVPPSGGLPEETEANPDPNLREREGCDGCHQTLEPAAAAFARWRVNGTHGFLPLDVMDFSAPDTTCDACGAPGEPRCSAFCNLYYVTGANADERTREAYDGFPISRAYLEDDELHVLEDGPASLVDEDHEIRRVASCTVRTVAERLLGRDLSQTESLHWVPALTEEFATNDYNYSNLVNTVVSSEVYRTIR